MKRKIVSLLLVAAMTGSLLAGCGSDSGEKENFTSDAYSSEKLTYRNPNIVTEAETPKEVEGYFKENNLTVEGAGVAEKGTFREFPYLTSVKEARFIGIEVDVETTCLVGIYEEVVGDTKTIFAEIRPDWKEVKGMLSYEVFSDFGFVDRYTGICYSAVFGLNSGETVITTINTDEKEYEISIKYDFSDMYDSSSEMIEITCPSDYDGAAFFVCGGNNELWDEKCASDETKYKSVPISEIEHGDYDMKFFAQ